MNERIRKIVVVGGGTAGWMAAAVLARTFAGRIEIELVESDDIGTVGVGEATIPQIRLLLGMLGIDEAEFLKNVQGTIKLGIEFDGWTRDGERYIHAFGSIGRPLGPLEFHNYWLRAHRQGFADSLWTYSLNAVAAGLNRYETFEQFGDTGLSGLVRAYHFDAGLVAKYLRALAEPWGVTRTEGRIVDTTIDGQTGTIESVVLDGGRAVAADFFIDCSGFRGLLIEEALESGYEDWTGWLPCDRAVAVPCESVEPLTPYTRAKARDAGWQWRIPLQHRTGNGYVYSSAFVADDDAARVLLDNLDGAPLAEPRQLRFVTGRRRKFWNRNCIALGLASGFLEPLESTSIHLVQSGLSRFLALFPDGRDAGPLADEYNRQCAYEFERIRDFLILHYHRNQRGGDFWADRRSMRIPDTLAEKIALFRRAGRLVDDAGDLFRNVAWLQVMLGQGINPETWHPAADVPGEAPLRTFFDGMRRTIAAAADGLSDHRAWIDANCAAREGA